MQRLSLASLQPGMTIGKDVTNADGRLLIRNGVVLNEHYIERLQRMGIGSVYIQTPMDEELHAPEIIQEETKIKAVKAIKKTFEKLHKTQVINTAELKAVVDSIMNELLHSRDTILHLTDIRTYDDYTFGHSINVSIYSAFVGMSLGYSEGKLKELALGALLHDIGKMIIPPEIINKPAKLSEEEMKVVKQHPAAGFDMLRRNADIPLVASHVAFQHHERFDGSGYPRGIKGQEIHEYARIAAIADVYDALTSDRPYRRGLLPHEAYEYLSSKVGQEFDYGMLKLFFRRVALYPVGTVLRLNTGEVGVVAHVIPEISLRPVVRVLLGKDGTPTRGQKQIDLTKELTVMIERVCSEAEIVDLYQRLGLKRA